MTKCIYFHKGLNKILILCPVDDADCLAGHIKIGLQCIEIARVVFLIVFQEGPQRLLHEIVELLGPDMGEQFQHAKFLITGNPVFRLAEPAQADRLTGLLQAAAEVRRQWIQAANAQ